MAGTVITWNVANLERRTSDGMVTTIHYTVDAKDDAYSAGAYGSMGLEEADSLTMVPFADLTPEVVIGWLKEKLGDEAVTNVEEALQKQLDEQHAPSVAAGVPWS